MSTTVRKDTSKPAPKPIPKNPKTQSTAKSMPSHKGIFSIAASDFLPKDGSSPLAASASTLATNPSANPSALAQAPTDKKVEESTKQFKKASAQLHALRTSVTQDRDVYIKTYANEKNIAQRIGDTWRANNGDGNLDGRVKHQNDTIKDIDQLQEQLYAGKISPAAAQAQLQHLSRTYGLVENKLSSDEAKDAPSVETTLTRVVAGVDGSLRAIKGVADSTVDLAVTGLSGWGEVANQANEHIQRGLGNDNPTVLFEGARERVTKFSQGVNEAIKDPEKVVNDAAESYRMRLDAIAVAEAKGDIYAASRDAGQIGAEGTIAVASTVSLARNGTQLVKNASKLTKQVVRNGRETLSKLRNPQGNVKPSGDPVSKARPLSQTEINNHNGQTIEVKAQTVTEPASLGSGTKPGVSVAPEAPHNPANHVRVNQATQLTPEQVKAHRGPTIDLKKPKVPGEAYRPFDSPLKKQFNLPNPSSAIKEIAKIKNPVLFFSDTSNQSSKAGQTAPASPPNSRENAPPPLNYGAPAIATLDIRESLVRGENPFDQAWNTRKTAAGKPDASEYESGGDPAVSIAGKVLALAGEKRTDASASRGTHLNTQAKELIEKSIDDYEKLTDEKRAELQSLLVELNRYQYSFGSDKIKDAAKQAGAQSGSADSAQAAASEERKYVADVFDGKYRLRHEADFQGRVQTNQITEQDKKQIEESTMTALRVAQAGFNARLAANGTDLAASLGVDVPQDRDREQFNQSLAQPLLAFLLQSHFKRDERIPTSQQLFEQFNSLDQAAKTDLMLQLENAPSQQPQVAPAPAPAQS